MRDFDILRDKIHSFVKERDWDKFHNPKDLAISISLEASELLECFQWKDNSIALERNKENMIKEISDIIIYCIIMSEKLGFDLIEAVNKKIDENAQKYPIDQSFGNSQKYTEFR